MEHPLLTVGDVAKLLHRSADTIRRYERDGLLRAQRTASGVRLFRLTEVEALRAAQREARQPGQTR